MKICSNKTNYNMKKINSSLIVEKLNNPSFSNLTNSSTKIIDMHTHTNYSDGALSPQELMALAIAKNIGTIAITDHNTIEGIKTINRSDKLIKDSDIKIINGIEISAKANKGRMHILGYGFDLNNKTLNKKLVDLKDNSITLMMSSFVFRLKPTMSCTSQGPEVSCFSSSPSVLYRYRWLKPSRWL